jgi:hypothetical protein
MSNNNYTLEIISHHPQFSNKSLRKYHVDGIDTVGAWGNEPFEIRFKNNTWQKIQVKLSVDGTDVFTGQPATTETDSKMWVVNGYGTLSLKAWPENNNGGAAFVFTSADNSVAIHTHGNLSSRGIIAAAVYTEGHVEPQRIEHHYHHHEYPYYWLTYPIITTYPTWYNYQSDNTAGIQDSFGITYNNSTTFNSVGQNSSTATMDCFNLSEVEPVAASADATRSKSLQSLVAVGAGQHVDQQITYVAGLIKPTFSETIRVRYLWWDDLVANLRKNNAAAPHASGFPGDSQQGNINLGKTPRLPKGGSFRRAEVAYQRV